MRPDRPMKIAKNIRWKKHIPNYYKLDFGNVWGACSQFVWKKQSVSFHKGCSIMVYLRYMKSVNLDVCILSMRPNEIIIMKNYNRYVQGTSTWTGYVNCKLHLLFKSKFYLNSIYRQELQIQFYYLFHWWRCIHLTTHEQSTRSLSNDTYERMVSHKFLEWIVSNFHA